MLCIDQKKAEREEDTGRTRFIIRTLFNYNWRVDIEYRNPIESGNFSPVSQRAPERRAEEFDERSEPHQKAALAGVHPHLLEIDAHQWEQGAERRVEEEIERLHREQFLVHGAEQVLDHVAFSTDLVRRLLRLGIKAWVDLAVGMGVDHGPHAWHLW